jgi:hypothetical protein
MQAQVKNFSFQIDITFVVIDFSGSTAVLFENA